jgi:hypothetical protein
MNLNFTLARFISDLEELNDEFPLIEMTNLKITNKFEEKREKSKEFTHISNEATIEVKKKFHAQII